MQDWHHLQPLFAQRHFICFQEQWHHIPRKVVVPYLLVRIYIPRTAAVFVMLVVMLMSSTVMRVRWNNFRSLAAFGYQFLQFSPVVMLVVSGIGIGVFQNPLGLFLGLFVCPRVQALFRCSCGGGHFWYHNITDGLRSLWNLETKETEVAKQWPYYHSSLQKRGM